MGLLVFQEGRYKKGVGVKKEGLGGAI